MCLYVPHCLLHCLHVTVWTLPSPPPPRHCLGVTVTASSASLFGRHRHRLLAASASLSVRNCHHLLAASASLSGRHRHRLLRCLHLLRGTNPSLLHVTPFKGSEFSDFLFGLLKWYIGCWYIGCCYIGWIIFTIIELWMVYWLNNIYNYWAVNGILVAILVAGILIIELWMLYCYVTWIIFTIRLERMKRIPIGRITIVARKAMISLLQREEWM